MSLFPGLWLTLPRTLCQRGRRVCIPVLAATLLLVSPLVEAYECVGPVTGTQISPTGVVSASVTAGMSWVYLCSVSSTTNGVAPDTCKTIYATLLTAETQGRQVILWFNDDPNTCASHAAWSWLTGWYWGPMLY